MCTRAHTCECTHGSALQSAMAKIRFTANIVANDDMHFSDLDSDGKQLSHNI